MHRTSYFSPSKRASPRRLALLVSQLPIFFLIPLQLLHRIHEIVRGGLLVSPQLFRNHSLQCLLGRRFEYGLWFGVRKQKRDVVLRQHVALRIFRRSDANIIRRLEGTQGGSRQLFLAIACQLPAFLVRVPADEDRGKRRRTGAGDRVVRGLRRILRKGG